MENLTEFDIETFITHREAYGTFACTCETCKKVMHERLKVFMKEWELEESIKN